MATAQLAVEQIIYSEWSKLLKTEQTSLTPFDSNYCDSTFCRIQYEQDYCGLKVVSDDTAYDGRIFVIIDIRDNARLIKIISSVVPMIPLHLEPSIDKEAAVQALIGETFTVDCPGEDEPTEITADMLFSVEDAPILFIKSLDEHVLEYHLSYAISFGPPFEGQVEGWPEDLDFTSIATGYIDAVDGSFLSTVVHIICS